MLFSAIFQLYRAAASAPIHAFLEFFNPVRRTIFFPSHWLLSHILIVKNTDSGERAMNPVTMTIINPQNDIGRAEDRISDLWYPAFSFFSQMFSTLSKRNCTILATLKLSSANACNLDNAKILSSGKWILRNMSAAKRMFSGAHWNQAVCPSMCLSVYKILY